MGIVVEHDKRRKEILDSALDVFIAEGFENATYQKIADSCGVTRTILYTYFRNKRDIFNYTIKQFLQEVEGRIHSLGRQPGITAPMRLRKTIFLILDIFEENKKLLSVILDYLLWLAKKSPEAVDTRVRRRTIRLRHILAGMIIDGIKAGELRKANIRAVDDLLYGILEDAIFRLTVLKKKTLADVRKVAEAFIKTLAAL